MIYYLLLASLTSFSANAQTSVYHPFPDADAVWNVHFYVYCFSLGFVEENYSIAMDGDTTISGKVYHKLNTPYVDTISGSSCYTTPIGYKGAFREDTALKKVFYVPSDSTKEQLMYDFNLVVGDTVKGYLGGISFWGADTVISIDSVLVGGGYRKRWNTNTCYNISYIEGVGSTYGLIQPSPGCFTDLPDITVTCFSVGGVPLYHTVPSATCDLITRVQDMEKKQSPVVITPNPFHESALITIAPEYRNSDWRIYNSLGALMREGRWMNQHTFELQREPLSSGVYFLQLMNNQGLRTTKKFVVE